jgi:ribulose-5-phosphate 4-epimerase/fuculose-1-phosphate aldolase
MECGLLPLNQSGMRFADAIGYHDFEGQVIDLAEKARIQQSLGSHNALILRNHGLLTCGPTIAEGFHLMRVLERSCQVQIDAMAAQTPLVMPPKAIIEKTAHLFKRNVRRPYGVLEWHAHLRKLDKIDSSFRN